MAAIDPMFSEVPPHPRTKPKPKPRIVHAGNGFVDGVVPHIQASSSLRSQALIPAFDHLHSTLVEHHRVANGLMIAMAALLMACMFLVLWSQSIGYIAAGIVVLGGLFVGLTSRFIFAGSCFALLAIALSSLAPHIVFFRPSTMATFTFVLLSFGMVYLLCENKFVQHTVKDKITTPRGIKNNPIFKRALVRKYQKDAPNGSTKL